MLLLKLDLPFCVQPTVGSEMLMSEDYQKGVVDECEVMME
jgi:hypothetical protein